MRWDAGANAGFTTGEPWLPIGDDVAVCNVQVQRNDRRSLLALYRRLLELRREEDRQVLDFRYLYRDRDKDDRGDGLGRECSDLASGASRCKRRAQASCRR